MACNFQAFSNDLATSRRSSSSVQLSIALEWASMANCLLRGRESCTEMQWRLLVGDEARVEHSAEAKQAAGEGLTA